MHYVKTCVVLMAASILLATHADAFELLMFRRAGCPWCAAWDREIGPIYGKTELGRRIAIRFIDLDQRDALKFKLESPVRFTPTFVLLDEDREIGRIEGYPGQDFFWGRLQGLVPSAPEKLGNEAVERGRGEAP
jgi:thioredoxin-related protein